LHHRESRWPPVGHAESRGARRHVRVLHPVTSRLVDPFVQWFAGDKGPIIGDMEQLDMKIEVMVIPVSDPDRAKAFYLKLGWRLDQTPPGVVQLTPHGSTCSLQFGSAFKSGTPGSGLGYVIVSDIDVARNALIAAGVEVGEIFHLGPDGPVSGPDPERRTY